MAIENKIEALKTAIGEEWSAYRTLAREGRRVITSSLTGGKELRGPLAPVMRGAIRGTVEIVALFFVYPLDRLAVGKSPQQIREKSDEIIGFIESRR